MPIRYARGRGGSHTPLQVRAGRYVAGPGLQDHAAHLETTSVPTRNPLTAPSAG